MMVPRAQDPDRRRRGVTFARVQKQNPRWNELLKDIRWFQDVILEARR